MEPLTTGDYPQSMRKLVGTRLPKFSTEQSNKLKKSYDFLGVNYYTANFVSNAPISSSETLSYTTDSKVTTTSKLTNNSFLVLLFQDFLTNPQ